MHRRNGRQLAEDADRRTQMVQAFTEPVKILIADARDEVRGVANKFLSQFNVTVYEAKDIGEAVTQATAHELDIVFVHMRIPLPSDGATLIRELKSLQPAIPVIAYDKDLNGNVGEAIRSVADECIMPVPAEVALAEELIHRILKTFHLSRRAGMEG
jgi:CheY-like chemotaxis protein